MSTRWTALSAPTDVADALCTLFHERGHERYDEAVSQTTHAVQAAELARESGAAPTLVVAALLHDIGHLFEPATDRERDLRHEEIGARLLSRWYGPEVTEPIRHHVAAKRYLCATEPAYAATLSPASVTSLSLQGGPMSTAEARRFESLAGSSDAVRLRRWDDLAKDPDRASVDVTSFWELLVRTVSAP